MYVNLHADGERGFETAWEGEDRSFLTEVMFGDVRGTMKSTGRLSSVRLRCIQQGWPLGPKAVATIVYPDGTSKVAVGNVQLEPGDLVRWSTR